MPQRLLKQGTTGADVKHVQGCLNWKAFSSPRNSQNALPKLALDGIFGPKTRAKVVEFQKREKLLADGVVGPMTLSRLFIARDPKVGQVPLVSTSGAIFPGATHETTVRPDGVCVNQLAGVFLP